MPEIPCDTNVQFAFDVQTPTICCKRISLTASLQFPTENSLSGINYQDYQPEDCFPPGKADKSIIMHMYYTQLNCVFGNQIVVNKRGHRATEEKGKSWNSCKLIPWAAIHDAEWSKAIVQATCL
ncbi:hypothetical protein BTVI_154671 [Pitangus sulphuratus]|nr:hypothetical protein BTVI_154671 [Pitangus sulphuratus]